MDVEEEGKEWPFVIMRSAYNVSAPREVIDVKRDGFVLNEPDSRACWSFLIKNGQLGDTRKRLEATVSSPELFFIFLGF